MNTTDEKPRFVAHEQSIPNEFGITSFWIYDRQPKEDDFEAGSSWFQRILVFGRNADLRDRIIALLNAPAAAPIADLPEWSASEAIERLIKGTAYPDSVSVISAFKQFWNEFEQLRVKPLTAESDRLRSELLKADDEIRDLKTQLAAARQAALDEGVRAGIFERENHELLARVEVAEANRDEHVEKNEEWAAGFIKIGQALGLAGSSGNGEFVRARAAEVLERMEYAETQLGYLAEFVGLKGATWALVVSETISMIERLNKREHQLPDLSTWACFRHSTGEFPWRMAIEGPGMTMSAESQTMEGLGAAFADAVERQAPIETWMPKPPENLREDIIRAINYRSADNGSDTPDWILGNFLMASLAAFDMATKDRTQYYSGSDDVPASDPPATTEG